MDPTFLKTVVKNLVEGTLEENLCRICLQPLGDACENIFTKICQANVEYCIADIFQEVFKIKFSESDNYCVCSECFIATFAAYNFFLHFQQTNDILEFYTEELQNNIDSIDLSEDFYNNTLCMTLPNYMPKNDLLLDPNVENCIYYDLIPSCEEEIQHENETPETKTVTTVKSLEPKLENDEDLVMIVNEEGVQSFYRVNVDRELELVYEDKIALKPVKKRKKRKPMPYHKCSQCEFKHRFLVKLKKHMKIEHNMDFYICKICKATMECEQEFNNHLKMHTNIHCCVICNTVFKKRATIIAHLKWHEEMDNLSQTDSVHVCEQCGFILPNESELQDHYYKRHDKKHSCHYCGRMYRLECSLEKHIEKHERYNMNKGEKNQSKDKTLISSKKQNGKTKTRFICQTCGKNFVDERALKWHNMLHTDERPFKCDTCGRGFISVNRRNQHALCAHSVPTRRCPLCPALFHLRSMVNSHIKKVHLTAHKRRNRTSKHLGVSWKTEAVPIRELSIDIQNEILELKTSDRLDEVTNAASIY